MVHSSILSGPFSKCHEIIFIFVISKKNVKKSDFADNIRLYLFLASEKNVKKSDFADNIRLYLFLACRKDAPLLIFSRSQNKYNLILSRNSDFLLMPKINII